MNKCDRTNEIDLVWFLGIGTGGISKFEILNDSMASGLSSEEPFYIIHISSEIELSFTSEVDTYEVRKVF